MQSLKLTWVLAHEPYEVFHKAARQFAQEVSTETNGHITIDVLDLPDYNAVAGTNLSSRVRGDRQHVIDSVNSGLMDMATVYINNLADINKDLHAWGLPYLFQDAEHAQRALDGKIGRAMLDGVAARSNVRPLEYTFSGGFRTMPSNIAIEKVSDFKHLKVRCTNNPVSIDLFSMLDAKPVNIPTEDFSNALLSGEVDSGEATYPRFFLLGYDKASKFINHTEHNLFLTSIVINQIVWNSFDQVTKDIFTCAARNAALQERAESLASVDQVQRDAAKLGIPTVKMNDTEKSKLVNAFGGLYDKYETIFSPGVVSGLRSVA